MIIKYITSFDDFKNSISNNGFFFINKKNVIFVYFIISFILVNNYIDTSDYYSKKYNCISNLQINKDSIIRFKKLKDIQYDIQMVHMQHKICENIIKGNIISVSYSPTNGYFINFFSDIVTSNDINWNRLININDCIVIYNNKEYIFIDFYNEFLENYIGPLYSI